MVGNSGRSLSGVLVNTGTLVHEAGTTYFNGASLRNSGTAEVRLGGWSSNTGTNSFVNTGTLNKVSPDPNCATSCSITVSDARISGLHSQVQTGFVCASPTLAPNRWRGAAPQRGASLGVSIPAGVAGR
jgi:hypothetical protein